ncbi:MAG: hypothetical protein Q9197_000646 [Variospora fuerteventurae]
MDSQTMESSEPAQAPPGRVHYHDFESLKMDLISVYDRIMQKKGQSSSAAQPDRSIPPDSAPCPPKIPEKGSKAASITERNSQAYDENAVVLGFGNGLTTSQEAQSGMINPNFAPYGNNVSFETIDSALGESFSDTEIQRHEPPIPRPMLIVKFSTTNPGRINATERRPAIASSQQTPIATVREDLHPSQPRHNAATPPNACQKRRGRPPVSKNQNPLRSSDRFNAVFGSQEQLSTASSTKQELKRHVSMDKSKSLTQSEIMRAVWAKRRRNGTDGHRGNAPIEKTLQKRALKTSLSGYSNGVTNDVSHGSTRRQLFSGQQGIDRASGSSLSSSAPRLGGILQQAGRHGPLDIAHSEGNIQSSNAGGPPLNVLPSLCRGDTFLSEIFRDHIYPILMSSKDHHEGTLPKETLYAICQKSYLHPCTHLNLQVASDTVDRRLRTFLRDNDYRLHKWQRKVIRKYIRKAYAAEVRLALERSQTDPVAEPIQFHRVGTNHTQHTSAIPPSQTDPLKDVPLAIYDGLEQAGRSRTITPINVTDERRRASTGGNVMLPKAAPDAPRIIESTGQAPTTQPMGVSKLKCCIACRSRKSKCTLQGTSCVSCKIAGKTCSFRPGDLEHNLKVFESAQVDANGTIIKRRASEPQNTSIQPLPPAFGQGVIFTDQVKQDEASSLSQYHGHHLHTRRLGSLHCSHDDRPALDSTHPDDPPANIYIREYSSLQTAGLKALSADASKSCSRINTPNTSIRRLCGESRMDPVFQCLSASSVLNPPSAFDPELELAFANATLCQAGGDRPYKSAKRGHYDFVRDEYISLLRILDNTSQASPCEHTDNIVELRRKLKTKLRERVAPGEALPEESITAIIRAAHSGGDSNLSGRKKKNIRQFLVEVLEDPIPSSIRPKFTRTLWQVKDAMVDPRSTISSLLRDREVGYGEPAQSRIALDTQLAENIRPWRSWKGASSDVVAVAWAPDSLSYAAGAAAQSDEPDLQYNRPRNLLFGNLVSNTVCELPDHRIERPKPETINSGANSTYAVYQACDPMVYKTVTSVQFSPTGKLFFTASDDRTVKIWDIDAKMEPPTCAATLDHKAEVTSLEVSQHYPTHFATASKTIDESVRVYQGSQTAYQTLSFSSSRAIKHRNHDIFPECIRWGLTPGTKDLLLAGYHQWADHDFSASRKGQICLWDVNTGKSRHVRPHASAIFSVAWHPREDIFITGGAPGGGPLSFPKTTRSVVRSYDVRNTSHFTVEFECPALDIQDVTCHPNNSNYVTAGCTDGTVYVWDYRWPDNTMHKLSHGQPLQELAPNDEELPSIEHRERVDAGVMLSVWGKGASLFYSGSSDGVIKAWDILRAPEDVWVKDIAHLPAGVQSGALSPDGVNMLVGDAVGGIHILSAAPFGSQCFLENDNSAGFAYRPDPINFRYADAKGKGRDDENPGTEGIECARELLRSGQLVLHPSLGVSKNPDCQNQENTSTGYDNQRPEIRQQAVPTNSVGQAQDVGMIKNFIAARREQIRSAKHDIKPFTITFGPPTAFVANKSSSKRPKKPPNTLKHAGARSQTPAASPPPFTASLTPSFAPATHGLEQDDVTYLSTTPLKRKRLRTPCTPSTPRKYIKAEVTPPSKRHSKFRPQHAEVEVVDLTGEAGDIEQLASPKLGGVHAKTIVVRRDAKPGEHTLARTLSNETNGDHQEENLLTWEQWVEDDFWWPEGC